MNRFEIAKAHAKNREKIRKAITQLNRSLNQSLKDNNEQLEYATIRVMIILYAAYLESTLPYLLYFFGAQIKMQSVNYILAKPSELEKWEAYVDYCFRRNFLDGKRRALNLINLKHTNFQRYIYLKEVLERDIRTVIEIRNKLAHGQWAIAFNSEGDGKNQEVTSKLWTLSKKDVLTIKNVVTRFTSLMESLIASKEHFSSSFDDEVGALEENKIIHEEKYDWIIDTIKSKKRLENV